MNRKKENVYTYCFLYKITNLITDKFYIGVHETNNLNDNYMGSGKALNEDIEKYGIENFKKEILEFFDDYKDAYLKEEKIVDKDFIKNDMTYNLKPGGRGGWHYVNSEEYWEENRERRSKQLKETFKNNLELRKQIGKNVSKYAKENPDKIKESNRKATESRSRISNFGELVSKGLNKHYASKSGDIARKKISDWSKQYWKSEDGLRKKEELKVKNRGYNNPEFIVLCKEKYEFYLENVLYYVLYTDLYDYLIIRKLKLTGKIFYKMLKYYEYLGFIEDKEVIYKSDSAHKIVTKKTKYKLKENNFYKDTNFFQNYKIIRYDYIDLFNKCSQFIFSEEYSDSSLHEYNLQKIIDYLLYLKIIKIKEIKKVNIRKIFPNAQLKWGKKTIIELNEIFEQDYILINKENIDNEYIIDIQKIKNYFFIYLNTKENKRCQII